MEFKSYKIPKGKMVKVRVNVDKNSIRDITILGDFFLHPEDTLPQIEQGLVGTTADEDCITDVIQSVLDTQNAVLIGASARDLAKAIMSAHETR
ncbi:MAG: hypothetical protein JSW05_00585 [Candidatus Thorarchaeota archaeon]|nr:MAG: hypothetical protein JSW05_00585 [Candidatus Thorarchaeota archaeon]